MIMRNFYEPFSDVRLLMAVTMYVLRFERRTNDPIAKNTRPIAVTDQSDTPRPFGYKTAWFAVKTSDTNAVISALNLRHVETSSWEYGEMTLNDCDRFIVMS